MTDWLSTVTGIAAGAAILGTIPSLIVARKNANAAIESAGVAKDALAIAKTAADAAMIQAEETGRQREILAEQHHNELHPRPLVTFERRESSISTQQALFAQVTVRQDSGMRVDLVHETGAWSNLRNMDRMYADSPLDVFVDTVPSGESKRGQFLLFKFWPHDGARCECGREPAYESDSSVGHWSRKVAVEWPPEPDGPWAAYR